MMLNYNVSPLHNQTRTSPFNWTPFTLVGVSNTMVKLNTVLAMKKENLWEEDLVIAQDFLEFHLRNIAEEIDYIAASHLYIAPAHVYYMMRSIYRCETAKEFKELYEKVRDKGREFYVYEIRAYDPNVLEN